MKFDDILDHPLDLPAAGGYQFKDGPNDLKTFVSRSTGKTAIARRAVSEKPGFTELWVALPTAYLD